MLRQDNADRRLMKYGYKFGLIPSDVYQRLIEKEELIKEGLYFIKNRSVKPSEVNSYLERIGSKPIEQSEKLEQIVKRPEVNIAELFELESFKSDNTLQKLLRRRDALRQVEIEIKYEGYIQRQLEEIERFEKYEAIEIPEDFDYTKVKSLSSEAREKLMRVRPRSIGQASRISGVSPADISVLMVYLKG
jgi:tRNA uridine 5-carboxymethylaminomethyl modification enzyme